MCLLVSEPRLRASSHDWYRVLDFGVIARFTRLQFAAAFVIFFVTLTPAGVCVELGLARFATPV